MKIVTQEEIHDHFCSNDLLDHQYGYQDREYCLNNCQTYFTYYCDKCGNTIHYQCLNKDLNVFMIPRNCDKCNPVKLEMEVIE